MMKLACWNMYLDASWYCMYDKAFASENGQQNDCCPWRWKTNRRPFKVNWNIFGRCGFPAVIFTFWKLPGLRWHWVRNSFGKHSAFSFNHARVNFSTSVEFLVLPQKTKPGPSWTAFTFTSVMIKEHMFWSLTPFTCTVHLHHPLAPYVIAVYLRETTHQY